MFDTGLGQATVSYIERGREIYRVQSNWLLDSLLDLKWDKRIINSYGDFSHVENDSARYWVSEKVPVQEYKYIDGKLIKSEREDTLIFVFTFVRGDCDRIHYIERNSSCKLQDTSNAFTVMRIESEV